MSSVNWSSGNAKLSCLPWPASSHGSLFSASSWSATLVLLDLLNFKTRSVCLQRKLDYFFAHLHACFAFFCEKHFLSEKEGVNKNRFFCSWNVSHSFSSPHEKPSCFLAQLLLNFKQSYNPFDLRRSKIYKKYHSLCKSTLIILT